MVDMDLEELVYYRLFDGTQWKRHGELKRPSTAASLLA